MRNPANSRGRAFDPLLAAAVANKGDGGWELAPGPEAITACAHCGGARLARWGRTRRGLQRWRCRSCRRSSCATTGTSLAHTHDLAAFAQVLADMLGPGPRSCRQLAAALGVGRMTVWRWRRQICRALQQATRKPPQDALAAPTRVVRESRKASREWVDHERDPHRFPAPDRLRWIDYQRHRLPLPDPMEPYRVGIHVLRDARGMHRIDLEGAFAVAESRSASSPSPATQPGPRSAHAAAAAVVEARCSRGPLPGKPELRPASVVEDGLDHRLAGFLEPFRGPATKYLRGYVAWFATRLDAGPGAARRLAWAGLLRSSAPTTGDAGPGI